jgi:hypothetical protein
LSFNKTTQVQISHDGGTPPFSMAMDMDYCARTRTYLVEFWRSGGLKDLTSIFFLASKRSNHNIITHFNNQVNPILITNKYNTVITSQEKLQKRQRFVPRVRLLVPNTGTRVHKNFGVLVCAKSVRRNKCAPPL